jgi:AraC family transcriptional regulator
MNIDANAVIFRAAALHIYEHIDDNLSVESVAVEVGVSASSLKRAFREIVEQSPGSFIRRVRLEFALRSLQDRRHSVLQAALAAGFEDHSAFTRSFRRAFGFAPSAARERHNVSRDLESIILEDPEFVFLADNTIAGVTETGKYFDCAPRAWSQLTSKLGGDIAADSEDTLIFVGIGHDNPHDSTCLPADLQVRFSAGVIGLSNEKSQLLQPLAIKAGQYAAFKYFGRINNIGLALHYIYGAWCTRTQTKISTPPLFLSERIPQPGVDMNVRILVPME